MSPDIERVAEAMWRADLTWKVVDGGDRYTSMARAAVEEFGLTEERAYEYKHLPSDRRTIITDLVDLLVARRIASQQHALAEVSRWVSPWRVEEQP